MRRMLALALCAALCLSLLCVPAVYAEEEETEPAYEGFLVSCPAAALQESGAPPLLRSGAGGMEHVFGDVYRTQSEAYAQWLMESGRAVYMEPNYVATLFDTDEGAESGDGGWPHTALHTEAAAALGLNGAGVRVAVIDSGIDSGNPDLTQAVILQGYDYIGQTAEMSDDVGHGTKVAQILSGDDNGRGMMGLAPCCELVPLRCFSKSHGATVAELALAITEAVTSYGCTVINMSWGLANESETLHRAVCFASDAGAALAAAAGNAGTQFPQNSLVYPAAYDEVVSVASVDGSLAIANDSMQNACVTVCAPGVDIPFVASDGAQTSGSGTSFATPCVSAAAALLKQYADLGGADFKTLLTERAADLGAEGRDDAFGYGLPRLDELLRTRCFSLKGDTLSASLLRPGGGAVILAAYDAGGRMSAARTASSASGYVPAACELPEGAARCAAYFLDEALCPLFEPYRFELS